MVVQCLPRRIGLIDSINQVTYWLDGGHFPETVGRINDTFGGTSS